MRTVSLISALMFALSFSAACGGDDDDDGTITPMPDAGGGGGGQPDAGGGGGQPDAGGGGGMSAENLGTPCPDGNCPNGEACVVLDFDGDQTADTGGFCTVPCEGQQDMTSCSNGYTGVGQPSCALQSTDGFSCALLCDTTNAQCPAGTMCIDPDETDTSTVGVCAPAPMM